MLLARVRVLGEKRLGVADLGARLGREGLVGEAGVEGHERGAVGVEARARRGGLLGGGLGGGLATLELWQPVRRGLVLPERGPQRIDLRDAGGAVVGQRGELGVVAGYLGGVLGGDRRPVRLGQLGAARRARLFLGFQDALAARLGGGARLGDLGVPGVDGVDGGAARGAGVLDLGERVGGGARGGEVARERGDGLGVGGPGRLGLANAAAELVLLRDERRAVGGETLLEAHERLLGLVAPAARAVELGDAVGRGARLGEGRFGGRASCDARLVLGDAAVEAVEVGAQRLDLARRRRAAVALLEPDLVELVRDAARQRRLLVERLALGAQRLVASRVRLDGGGGADERVGRLDALGETGALGLGARAPRGQVGERLAVLRRLAVGGVQPGDALAELGVLLGEGAEARVERRERGHDRLALGGPGPDRLQGLGQARHVRLQPSGALAQGRPPRRGRGGEAVVAVQAQDAAQDLLALGRLLLGELVRAALEQKRRVDERLVVDAQARVDGGLRLAHAARGERLVRARAGLDDLEFQPRLRGLARRRLLVAADDAVARLVEVERQVHLHLARADAQDLLVGLALVGRLAGLAPDGPGDGVQERALALAVAAREAGDVEAREVERLRALAVGEEVAELETNGDHDAITDSIDGQSSAAPRHPRVARRPARRRAAAPARGPPRLRRRC